jgi:hypothetical protein
MARKLVLLTYNIDFGADLAEYGDYTRAVDYPKFRQNPHIHGYSNFVVRHNARGKEWFKHFDLMFVDDLDAYHSDGRLHFGDPVILEHAKNWRERWGRDRQTGEPVNINITYADEIWG